VNAAPTGTLHDAPVPVDAIVSHSSEPLLPRSMAMAMSGEGVPALSARRSPPSEMKKPIAVATAMSGRKTGAHFAISANASVLPRCRDRQG
jgi:hypothetical protein